jgi:hypothetical protein
VTNTTQRQFKKGDVVRCIAANFITEQRAITPNLPKLGYLYIIRAALPNSTSTDIHSQVILLEDVHNKTYRVIYNGKECLTESGFNPARFELLIGAEDTDWAVGQVLLTLHTR